MEYHDLSNTRYTDSIEFRCLENLQETSMDLSLIHCGKEQCQPMHLWQGVREEYIIHFIISGSGIYTVNGKSHTIGIGQMFLICPGTEVSYIADRIDPWCYAWVGFNGLRAENILRHCGFSDQKLVLDIPIIENVLINIDRILNCRQLSLANDLRRNSYVLELLSLLIDQNTLRSTTASSLHDEYNPNTYVNHAIEYIRTAYPEGINVTDVAKYVGISRTYLNNSFQKEIGISVQKFLIDFRMHKAANLLMSTTAPVCEISLAVGYDDALAFSKSFKKKFGASPRHFRETRQSLDNYNQKQ